MKTQDALLPLISHARQKEAPATAVGDRFPAALRGKRILLATESFGPVNGVSRTTLMLVEYLRANGAHVQVVSPFLRDVKLQKVQADLRLPGYALPYNPDLSVVYPFRLDYIYSRTFVPDVIYLASPASVGFQFLLQIRQLIANPPTVLCNFQTDLSAYAEIIFPSLMADFGVWLLRLVQGFLFRHHLVQTIFYPSAPIRTYLESAAVPSEKLVHLGRGVDTDFFNPSFRDEAYRAELAPNGEPILICVCRLAPEKGFNFLAQAAERLESLGFPFRLLIVGGNRNPSVEEEVRKYFDRVAHRVTFTGFLTGAPLARAYASADLFLHCSITETFGLVVLEAMASGIPVIARDQGGPSEIVRHAETGFLVPPNDLDDFVTKTRQLCKDTDMYTDFCEAARRTAVATTWEKINRTVAWHIAAGLERTKRAQESRGLRKVNEKGTWISDYGVPLVEKIRFTTAVCIVAFFWLIAVLPLIVHGNLVFRNRNKKIEK